ncbi:MAG: Gfo/Idh/MocA family oxidoreductase, partial [Clostridia bacterium]|nr:Gfo/Idh/MocA family oxidoreductase [Clostridia bacterium]
ILIGGGDRGSCYLKYLDIHPEKFSLEAIAEPVKAKRDFLRDKYGVPADMCFESYEDIFKLPKFADIVLICTQDKMHFAPAMRAIENGYHILLEKPISPSPEECYILSEKAKEAGVKALVCFVLRYTPYYKTIKRLIDDGTLGDVMNVIHSECVGNVHMSHSFVRGNWSKEEDSAPMILAKCCHDTDLFQWLLSDYCTEVQSFGSLTHFTEKNRPEGAPERCLDGCPHKDTCFYYAPSLYRIDTTEVGHFRAIVANKFDPTDEEVDEALVTSPYGRCVYCCDNDVVDHQVVNVKFGDDKLLTLTMSGFNEGGRVTTVMGTKGELRCDDVRQTITLYDFATRKTTKVFTPETAQREAMGGHGGGDMGIMEDLYEYVANDNPSVSVSDISLYCMSHLIAFAAEEARKSGNTIKMKDYLKTLNSK